VDWADRGSAIEYLVGYARVLAGGERPFDEAAGRELVRRDVARAHDIAAAENHGRSTRARRRAGAWRRSPCRCWSSTAPADPMFPLEHGRALAREIRGARLFELDGAGHGVDRADRELVVDAIVEHTAPTAAD
jgi:pimeloyl-ACP methyl ester carboxylesterase